ncbi:MAG: deoxyribodipyrimidine photo-lyase [Bacteroidia bacterium]|nr:MAG: deoxyribodipyrimidine photo-lyase [Bacteroidia bacterium]
MKDTVVLFWFRRDLRINDNHALYRALQSDWPVVPIFIFDKNILNSLPMNDKRVNYIYDTLYQLNHELFTKYQSGIEFYYDYPESAFEQLIEKYNVVGVYTNKDYEPYAIQRDKTIREFLQMRGIELFLCKDHVIFEENEILKSDGKIYNVYTHYSKAWKNRFQEVYSTGLNTFPSEKYLHNLLKRDEPSILPSLKSMNFEKVNYVLKPLNISDELLHNYATSRDRIDAENGTTNASVYLRFGTISTRELVNIAMKNNLKLLDELIWREFYQMILFHYPESSIQNFKSDYSIQWENNETYFELWKEGKTGFPIIDAAMRELNETGYMHNRCRMIVANFLTKILLIDWRWGEKYFAEKLMDYEMASNVGNWQWSAGTGVGAAPYFRIFNPYLQQEKFDPEYKYVKKWIDNFNPENYIKPIVDYEKRRSVFLRKRPLIKQ